MAGFMGIIVIHREIYQPMDMMILPNCGLTTIYIHVPTYHSSKLIYIYIILTISSVLLTIIIPNFPRLMRWDIHWLQGASPGVKNSNANFTRECGRPNAINNPFFVIIWWYKPTIPSYGLFMAYVIISLIYSCS